MYENNFRLIQQLKDTFNEVPSINTFLLLCYETHVYTQSVQNKSDILLCMFEQLNQKMNYPLREKRNQLHKRFRDLAKRLKGKLNTFLLTSTMQNSIIMVLRNVSVIFIHSMGVNYKYLFDFKNVCLSKRIKIYVFHFHAVYVNKRKTWKTWKTHRYYCIFYACVIYLIFKKTTMNVMKLKQEINQDICQATVF